MSVNLYDATTDTLKNVAGDIINVRSVNEMVAPVEEGATASRAYLAGEQFIIDNVLYYAMTNIAQDEAFDYDVNYYESSAVTNQINDKQNKTDLGLQTDSKTVVGAINEVNSDATKKWSGTDSGNTYVTVDKLAYDPTNKRLGLKVNGADTVIPFNKEILIASLTTSTNGTFDVSFTVKDYQRILFEEFNYGNSSSNVLSVINAETGTVLLSLNYSTYFAGVDISSANKILIRLKKSGGGAMTASNIHIM